MYIDYAVNIVLKSTSEQWTTFLKDNGNSLKVIIDEINTLINPELKSYIYILPTDFIKDSKTEYLIESDLFNIYINPNDAGTIFELDYKPKSYNLLNTLTRWPEAYHESKKLESEEIISIIRLRELIIWMKI